MQTLPEFFRGSIAQDFQAILDAEPSSEPGSFELAGKAKKPPETRAPECKVRDQTCDANCTIDPKTPVCTNTPKRKAAAFQPGVQGWSNPPAPPAF
jgi:hypothetical protein